MSNMNLEQLAYTLSYNLPIKAVVPTADKLKLRFTMQTAVSIRQYLYSYNIEGNNIQRYIDNFFNAVVAEGISYIISDVENQIIYKSNEQTTIVNIAVSLVGENAPAFINDIERKLHLQALKQQGGLLDLI